MSSAIHSFHAIKSVLHKYTNNYGIGKERLELKAILFIGNWLSKSIRSRLRTRESVKLQDVWYERSAQRSSGRLPIDVEAGECSVQLV